MVWAFLPCFHSEATFLKTFPTHRVTYCNIEMFMNLCQRAIPVGVDKSAELTLVIFTPPIWLIHSGIASEGMVSLGTTTVGNENGFTERPGDGGL